MLNGGLTSLDEAETHLKAVDGVMLGRAAYQNPYLLANVDTRFYDSTQPVISRLEIIERLLPYVERELSNGAALKHIGTCWGCFRGSQVHVPGAGTWLKTHTCPWRVLIPCARHSPMSSACPPGKVWKLQPETTQHGR